MRYISVVTILFFIIISIGLQSCSKQPPIEENKFVKIYADMIFMQDTSSLSQLAIKEKVLKQYSVTESDYDNTIKIYNEDPEKWSVIFDSVVVYIESLKPKPKNVDGKSLLEQSLSPDRKNP
jgi:hypothetical protein